MTRAPTWRAATGRSAPPARVAVAAALGTTVEYYDFFVFGTASALVFGTQFFTPLSPASGTLAALASFGVGFLARPLGGAIWGHLGDRFGRRPMLVVSLLLMGVATVGVGLLPTYADVGVLAPVLLVALRLVQGLSVGGEWGGAALMTVEHSPQGRRGRYGSYCQIGQPAGMVLASLAFLVIGPATTSAAFQAWGWRLPFLASAILVGIGLFVRLGLDESPEFRGLCERGERARAPLGDVLRGHGRAITLAAMSFVAHSGIATVFLVYLVTYGQDVLDLPRSLMLAMIVLGASVFLVSVLVAGDLSDRLGRRPVYVAGSVLLVVWPVPFFLLIDTRLPALLTLAAIVLGLGLGATNAAQPAMFAELFPAHVRYSGVSLAFAVGAVIGGGLGPPVAAGLQQKTGTSLAISSYLVLMAVVSLGAVVAIGETAPIAGSRPVTGTSSHPLR